MKSSLYLLEGVPRGIAVDASCIPDLSSKKRDGYFHGRTEWQGVDLETGEKIISSSVYHRSTINLGEFCAIVDGLRWMDENNKPNEPVWSDSKIAIDWVRSRTLRTYLPRTKETTDALFEAEAALAWLNSNRPDNPILWWNKYELGENPADFGRK